MNTTNESLASVTTINVTGLLRLLGGASVLLAGGIYMLQGLTSLDMGLRNWIIVVLMLVLTGAGLTCRFLLQDGTSARLLLTLATAMFPIQCSQLGRNLLQADNNHNLIAIITGIGSLLMLPSLWLGFSVLMRPYALRIVGIFIVLCGAIILPIRTTPDVFFLFGAMIGGLFAAQKFILPILTGAKNLDVIVVRLLLLFPVIIVLARQVFYVNDDIAAAQLALTMAMVLITQGVTWSGTSGFRDLLIVVGTFMLTVALYLLNPLIKDSLGSAAPFWLLAIGFYVLHNQLHYLDGVYRKAANVLVVISIFADDSIQLNGALVTWFLSMLVIALAIKHREKLSLATGVLLLLFSVTELLSHAFSHVHIHYWLGLALGGVVLVLSASAMERYGKHCLQLGQEYWQELKAWDY